MVVRPYISLTLMWLFLCLPKSAWGRLEVGRLTRAYVNQIKTKATNTTMVTL